MVVEDLGQPLINSMKLLSPNTGLRIAEKGEVGKLFFHLVRLAVFHWVIGKRKRILEPAALLYEPRREGQVRGGPQRGVWKCLGSEAAGILGKWRLAVGRLEVGTPQHDEQWQQFTSG